MKTKYKVLFYVLFEGNFWDIRESVVICERGTPRDRVIYEGSAWLDIDLKKEWMNGGKNVVHQGPVFQVYDIYECNEAPGGNQI